MWTAVIFGAILTAVVVEAAPQLGGLILAMLVLSMLAVYTHHGVV